MRAVMIAPITKLTITESIVMWLVRGIEPFRLPSAFACSNLTSLLYNKVLLNHIDVVGNLNIGLVVKLLQHCIILINLQLLVMNQL